MYYENIRNNIKEDSWNIFSGLHTGATPKVSKSATMAIVGMDVSTPYTIFRVESLKKLSIVLVSFRKENTKVESKIKVKQVTPPCRKDCLSSS